MTDDDGGFVGVGGKKLDKYVSAVLKQNEDEDVVKVSARGRNIQKAVTLLEIVKNEHGFSVDDIWTETQQKETETGDVLKKSAIHAYVKR